MSLLCKVMKVSSAGFYKWLALRTTEKSQQAEIIKETIKKEHTVSRETYGRRRIFARLQKAGLRCGKNRVGKLMKMLGLRGVGKAKFKVTTQSSHSLRVCPNLIVQDFKVKAPDILWTSDITYIPTREGWLYLCVVLDAFARRIVGWSMQTHMRADLVLEAIKMSLKARSPLPGVIFHTDRGSQYACSQTKKILREHHFHQSMSGTGNCFDNSITETFFATLKKDLVYRTDFCTRKEAKTAIFEYIEVFYNRIRSHSSLGYMSPKEYESSNFN